ncbi:PEP-CTERM sorting domain-containing protein [Oscillatoria salina]|uniref:PEP-CTERM sorting domain-containing protein n=1 Tax=Oscillatoria salina TaxID=331517 RepID=UPI001CCF186E|nr:PEP-CTERM sorting domain-containing protein [Oscillatoria salina]MBZ8179794.1 PEP-CTERM sorting domain-containing protein [Oscillatoria salina IIICB1]
MANKRLMFILGCAFTLAGTTLISKSAKAASLDWDTTGWSDGQKNGSFVVGEGTIDIDFEVGSGIKFIPSSSSGITPAVSDFLNGSNPNSDKSLHLQIDSEKIGAEEGDYSVTMNTVFNNYSNPLSVFFTIFDLDMSSSKLWQDRVIVQGFLDDQEVDPIFQFAEALGKIERVDANTLDGIKSTNNNSDASNVLVSFASQIDSFKLVFTDGDDISRSNPNGHGIGIGDIYFTETNVSQDVPEPGSLAALGFVSLLVARSRRKNSNNS